MIKRFGLRCAALCMLMLLAPAIHVSAHEKWFYDTKGYGLRWDLFFRPLPLAFVGAVLLVTLAAWGLWNRRRRGYIPGPENFSTSDDRRDAKTSHSGSVDYAKDRSLFYDETRNRLSKPSAGSSTEAPRNDDAYLRYSYGSSL